MHTFILQDYTTIRGATSTTVTQNESGWLDLSQFQDVIAWVDVRELTTSATLKIQTSPVKDEIMFQDMYSAAAAVGVVAPPIKVLMSAASVPLARYVRWQLVGGAATWDLTFRILIAANSPGM